MCLYICLHINIYIYIYLSRHLLFIEWCAQWKLMYIFTVKFTGNLAKQKIKISDNLIQRYLPLTFLHLSFQIFLYMGFKNGIVIYFISFFFYLVNILWLYFHGNKYKCNIILNQIVNISSQKIVNSFYKYSLNGYSV